MELASEARTEAEVGAPGDGGADAALCGVVARAQAGDAAAFEDLYRRFGPSVHGILLARVTPAEADEAAHEVFVIAHRRLDQLREPGSIGPWLHAIARNAAMDVLRARRRTTRIGALPDDVAGPQAPDDGELRERVLHHIRSLPEAYRETLLLRLVEGLSGPEIAAVTGLTAASVRVNLHRGMEMLRPLLKKEGWP